MASNLTKEFAPITTFHYVSKRTKIIRIIVGSFIFLMAVLIGEFCSEMDEKKVALIFLGIFFFVMIISRLNMSSQEYVIVVQGNNLVYKNQDDDLMRVSLPCEIVQTEKTIALRFNGVKEKHWLGSTKSCEKEPSNYELKFDILDRDKETGKTVVEFLREANVISINKLPERLRE